MKIIIDGDFCFDKGSWLAWADIQYGLTHGYLNSQSVVKYAIKRLQVNSSKAEYELAMLSGKCPHEVSECVARLTAEDMEGAASARDKWVYLILLWLFENKKNINDPLSAVEAVYADFGYPEFLAPVIRYMPSSDGAVGEEVLMKKWEKILHKYKERF